MESKRESSRRLRQKERKHYTDDCLDDEEIEGRRMFSVEEKLVSAKFKADFVKEMQGTDFSLKYLQEKGFSHPFVFKDKTGLGIRMPTQNFTVNDVRQCVGSRRIIDVMDTETQTDTQMTMKEWCKYFENKEQRDRLLNVISLEFSHTRLENYVESPTFVRQVDWSDTVWPRFLKESQVESTNRIEDMKYPKVQKYCLMSVKGCYTDFHVDFGGTSVWYHILHGKKVFWLIPPTDKNLGLYEQWVLSGKQGDVFFGDQVEKCARIKLDAGYTFLIPSGWIHAVYTPEDSLVFGGNFLHSFGVVNQLRIASIEDATHVQQKFRYPFFTELHWYVLQRYVYCLMGKWHLRVNEEGESMTKGLKKLKDEKEEHFSDESAGSFMTPPDSPKDFRDSSFRESDDKENIKGGKRPFVNLTKIELNGIKNVLKWLQSNQRGRKCVPDLIKDPEALLRDCKELLELHENDDQHFAITGKPVLYWSESSKKEYKPRGQFHPVTKNPVANKSSANTPGNVRRRRTRCKKCDACLRSDCGECHYCKDMRKFGGPGRMKQSCIARQCMVPVLPHTASCLLCGKDGCLKGADAEPESTSLMECSQCWEILHPDCINAKYPGVEGNINEDLPNSWECPKCVLKTEETGSSGALKPRSMKKYKLPSEMPSMRADSMDESSNNSNDAPMEQNQNKPDGRGMGESSSSYKRKSEESLEFRKKKCEEYLQHSLENKDRSTSKVSESDQRRLSPSHVRSCARNANIRSVSSMNLKTSAATLLPVKNKSTSQKLCQTTSRTPRLALLNSRERLVRRMKGLKKSSSELVLRAAVSTIRTPPGRIKRPPTTTSVKNGAVSPKEESSSEISSPSMPQQISVKVDKLCDAASPKVTSSPAKNSPLFNRHKMKCLKTEPDEENNENKEYEEDLKQNGTSTNQFPPVKEESQKNLNSSSSPMPGRLSLRDRSMIKRPRFVVRPAPIVQEVEKKSGRGRHVKKYSMEKSIMLKVFRYLTPGDLFQCQIVCKTWNAWCVEPVLWKKMEMCRCKLTSMHLIGIVRRQPVSLDLGWTNISRKQLSWLVARLPQMRQLNLAGCSWAAVSALCSADCPLLSGLDLNWVEGINDATIRDLLSKPPASTVRPGFIENKTRLRNLTEIKLAGADISDMAVRLLVQNLSLLSNFSISQCRKITDMGIAVLATAKAAKLVRLDVSGCINVSDTSLESLKRCVNLVHLDMRECPQVSMTACQRFLFHNRSRFVMKEDRLFIKVR